MYKATQKLVAEQLRHRKAFGPVVIVDDMCSELLLYYAPLLETDLGIYPSQETILRSFAGEHLINESVNGTTCIYENHYLKPGYIL